MNGHVRNVMKERDSALQTAIKSKMSHDRHIFSRLRNKATRELRKAKADFFITIIENAQGNSKAIWSQIKK